MSRDPFADAARRHAHAVAGHILLAAEPCGIPASVLTLDVLVEQVEDLRAAQKYSLRAMLDGVDNLADLGLFLGLTEGEIAEVVASLLQFEYVDYRPAAEGQERLLSLLPAGTEAARDAQVRQPKPSTIPVVYDRLAGTVTDWRRASLIRARAAREDGGRVLLPPATSQPVRAEDVSPTALTETFSRGAADAVRVLGVNGVTENRNYYRDAILLVFKDLESDDVQLGVELDGAWSEMHGDALERLGAVARLGITSAPAEPADDDGIVDRTQRLEMREVIALQAAMEDSDRSAIEDNTLQRSAIRWLGVYEHPQCLEDALTHSKSRLLLNSPWITRSVVTSGWVARVEKLARTVDVTIFWGFGDNAKTDSGALDDLHQAARRSSRLAVVRVDDTHAKILVSDEYYIKTSFNWLSFRGARDRKYRQEEGDLVQDRELADKAYEKYMTENCSHALDLVGNLPARFRNLVSSSAPQQVPTGKARASGAPPTEAQPTSPTHSARHSRREALQRLHVGDLVSGPVKNLTNFGAFVSLDGVDGLIHISELSGRRVEHPSEVVSVGETVTVKVLDVDIERDRVSLSLRAVPR